MEKKFYTTIKTFPCVSKSGTPYTGITAILSLSNIQVKTVNDKPLVTARAAINNRTKLLNEALGTSFPETDETVWVDVNFWESRADRFQKFLGDRTKVLVGVMGTITARKFPRQDGSEGEALALTADEWFGVGNSKTEAPQNGPDPSIPTLNADDDLPY